MGNVTIGLSGRMQLLEILVEELLALQLGTVAVDHRSRLRERLITCAQLACDDGANGAKQREKRLATAVDELFRRAEQRALAAPGGIAVDVGEQLPNTLSFGLAPYFSMMFPPAEHEWES